MKRLILMFVFVLGVASNALAHLGPRIWIGNVDGKITTFRSDNDLSPTDYAPCRLFRGEMEQTGGIYTTNFPGYEARREGSNIASGTTFRFDITGPALYFDDISEIFVTTAEAFGPPEPGPIPQLALTLGGMEAITDDRPVSGFDFYTFNAIGDHSHLSHTLLGDGENASDGPSGVYAVSMTLSSVSLETSETYYLLLGKDVGISDPLFDAAFEAARETLVGAGMPGDMDCNGIVDSDDMVDFIDAVITSDSGVAPGDCCNVVTADMNDDQAVNGLDVAAFVDALVAP